MLDVRVLLLALMLLSGCVTIDQPQYIVAVDSLASSTAKEKNSYILLPGNEGVTSDDLQFQEYSIYLDHALRERGFVSAEKAEDADVAVVLSYGIGDPETHQYTYTLPVWGQTGVSSAYTHGTATAYGNSATYSGTTTYTPSYGVTGYATQLESITTYTRHVFVAGYDFKVFTKSDKQIQLWRTNITSTGSNGDLRRVFPILIAAGAPYFARNTGHRVSVQLEELDEVVQAVKYQLPNKKRLVPTVESSE